MLVTPISPIFTLCFLVTKYDLSKLHERVLKPYTFNLVRRRPCGIQSNAFDKSIATIPTVSPVSKAWLNTGTFPDKLKTAKVLPIYKKGEDYLLEIYRPISIIPSISKVFERIIHKQLFNYFTENKIFYEKHYGFRSQHSTEMAALELVDRITCAMDRKQTSLSIF